MKCQILFAGKVRKNISLSSAEYALSMKVLTLSAPNFRRHLSSAFFFKQTMTWKEVYM